MALTSEQAITLAAAITADQAFDAIPHTADGADAIAALLNAPSSPTFSVWRTDAPVNDIFDAIDATKYTPTDAPDTTVLFQNRAIAIQIKQTNLQMLTQGKTSLDAGKANVRAWLRDCVIALPSGASGASTSAGGASGVNVLNTCTRNARYIEKILAGSSATTGTVTANLLGFEGTVNYQDVQSAMGW